MQGKTLQAVEYCHKALDKQRQDPFTLQLLEMCLSCLSQEGIYCTCSLPSTRVCHVLNFILQKRSRLYVINSGKSENEDDDDDEDGDVLIRLPQFNLPVHITPTSYK